MSGYLWFEPYCWLQQSRQVCSDRYMFVTGTSLSCYIKPHMCAKPRDISTALGMAQSSEDLIASVGPLSPQPPCNVTASTYSPCGVPSCCRGKCWNNARQPYCKGKATAGSIGVCGPPKIVVVPLPGWHLMLTVWAALRTEDCLWSTGLEESCPFLPNLNHFCPSRKALKSGLCDPKGKENK